MTTATNSQEILNLHYHRILLLIKALNKYDNKNQASAKLGISTRTIDRDIRDYGIIKVGRHKSKRTYLPPNNFQQRFLQQTG